MPPVRGRWISSPHHAIFHPRPCAIRHPTGGRAISFVESIVAFVRAHQDWAVPVTLLLAFGESLAVISLLLPATAILAAMGGLMGVLGLPLGPMIAAAAVGAFLGDWLSYSVGYRFRDTIGGMWPLSRHPDLLTRAAGLFARWGIFGVFLGRFLGPLRASVPLVAGMSAMPWLPFQAANIASAIVWAVGLLAPGVVLSYISW